MFENCSKSKYAQGWDLKLKEPATLEIMEIGVNALLDGYSKTYVARLLVEELGMKGVQAQAFASKMWMRMSQMGTDRGENAAEKNLARLDRIYQRAMANGDLKEAIHALDIMNKITGVYKEKIQITTEDFTIDLLGDGDKKDVQN